MNINDILETAIFALKDKKPRKRKERIPDYEKLNKIVNYSYKLADSIIKEPPTEVSIKSIYKENFQRKYPLKAKAHKLVNQKLITGELKRERCEICGKGIGRDIHAHHDDYSKPLEVRWLCRKHHQEWHKNNKAKYNPELEIAQKVRKND